MSRSPAQTRTRLLAAAARLIGEQGGARLTLDLVAHNAGISKGGLLHHYPTKDALVRGLTHELATVLRARLNREMAAEPEGAPGRWARAYIRATFHPEPLEEELTEALAGAVTAYPELLPEVRAAFAFLDEDARRDGLAPARATTIRLACDGLWLGECAGLPLVAADLLPALHDDLVALSRP